MTTKSPCDDLIPLGYRITKDLGTGMFGTCYLCKNNYGDAVVLKKYNPEVYFINQRKNHYEAVLLSTLCHPLIPTLHGTLHTSCSLYLILEYMPGVTLNTALFQEQKIFSDFDISRIMMQLLSIMHYLHQRNIVHRDISIDNIIDDGVHISLVDFGMSRSIRYENMGAQIDFYCFGEVLLFLLYSRHRKKSDSPSMAASWYQELTLDENQKYFISRLLGSNLQFNSVYEVMNSFSEFIKKGLKPRL